MIEPKSRDYGASLGGSIARYYIDLFVNECFDKLHLQGKTIVEIGDEQYGKLVKGSKRLIIRNTVQDDDHFIFADLETGEGCEDDICDAIILTNVLSCLFEIKNALVNSNRMLKKGGAAIITVPGIAQITQQDNNTYGQFWRLTPMCLERLLREAFVDAEILLKYYGNVKTTTSFLYGEPVASLNQEELEYTDPDYPMLIGAMVIK